MWNFLASFMPFCDFETRQNRIYYPLSMEISEGDFDKTLRDLRSRYIVLGIDSERIK